MPFGTTIQSLTGAHSGTYGPAVDWLNNKVYETSGAYISRYGLVSGLEEANADQAALGIPATYPLALGQDGNLITEGPGAPFNGGIQTIDPSTLASISGGAFSGVSYGGGDFAGVQVGGDQWCVAVGPGGGIGGTHKILICEGVTQVYSEGWPAGTNVATLCPGPSGSAKVYMCVGAFSSGDTQQITLNSYECNLGPVINKDTIVVLDPTDIDAAWTEIYPCGFCLDQTDDNLIMFVAGQSGATTLNYLIKIDVSDGSILWQHTVLGAGSSRAGGFRTTSRSSITQGQFGYVCTASSAKIVIVDTSDGSTISTQTTGINGFSCSTGNGFYNDTLGAFVGIFSYNYIDADSPARLNSTPSTFNGYGVLYIAPGVAPGPGPGDVGDAGSRRWMAAIRPRRTFQPPGGA